MTALAISHAHSFQICAKGGFGEVNLDSLAYDNDLTGGGLWNITLDNDGRVIVIRFCFAGFIR